MRCTITLLSFLFAGLLSVNAQNDMTSLGASGGCQDGINAAYSNSKSAYNSIINNSSISQEYKLAYIDAFVACKKQKLAEISNKWKIGKSSDANYKGWKTYVLWGKLK